MYKRKFCFLILFVTIFLSGCSKFDSDMNIKKDGSMDFSVLYTYDGANDPSGIINENNKQKLLNSGYVLEDYKDGNTNGIRITKNIKNIEDVSEENKLVRFDLFNLLEDNGDLRLFKVEKNFLFDTYTARFYISNKDGILNGSKNLENTDNGQVQSYDSKKWGDSDNFKFNLKVPYFVGENNATTVSGNRRNLSWDLSKFSSLSTIEFKFYIINKRDAIILGVGIGLFLILIIAANGNKDNPQKDNDKNKITIPKKETYQTPINIPSTPVTTGEVSNSASFDFLNSDSRVSSKKEVANDIFDIKTNTNSTDDVNFIIGSQLYGDSNNNSNSNTSNNSNTGVSGLEEFMNGGSTTNSNDNNITTNSINNSSNINDSSNINNVEQPVTPPLNPDGGIPELMVGVEENNDNNSIN